MLLGFFAFKARLLELGKAYQYGASLDIANKL